MILAWFSTPWATWSADLMGFGFTSLSMTNEFLSLLPSYSWAPRWSFLRFLENPSLGQWLGSTTASAQAPFGSSSCEHMVWRFPLRAPLQRMVVHRPRILRRQQQEPIGQQSRTLKGIFRMCGWCLRHAKACKVSLRISMNLMSSYSGISGHFEAHYDFASPFYFTELFQRLSLNSFSAVGGAQMTSNATSAPFTALTSIHAPLYDRRGNVVLDDPMSLMVYWLRFYWLLFYLCWISVYACCCFLGVLLVAGLSTI